MLRTYSRWILKSSNFYKIINKIIYRKLFVNIVYLDVVPVFFLVFDINYSKYSNFWNMITV